MDLFEKYIIKLGKNYLFDENYDIVIYDITKINPNKLDLLYDEFLIVKEKSVLLLSDLQNIKGEFCFDTQRVIYSIKTLEFELKDISKLTPSKINENYVSHLKKLKNLLEEFNFEEYINIIPEEYKTYKFLNFTEIPGKSILGYNRNFRELWELDDEEYWKFLRKLWNNSIGINFLNGFNYYKSVKNRKTGSEFFMTYDERIEFEKLPEEITIYRGYVDSYDPKEISYSSQNESEFTKKRNEIQKNSIRRIINNGGFSFTLSKTIGLKYVEKYKQYNRINEYGYVCESKLFEITIPKKFVLGLLNHNQEEEIVVILLDHLHYY
jgi:hypothetical protein